MTSQGGPVQKVIEKPTNVVYELFQKHQRVCIWLLHDNQQRFEGVLIGYDEFMNLVLDDTVELNLKTHSSTPLGRLLLKGDSVGLIHELAN